MAKPVAAASGRAAPASPTAEAQRAEGVKAPRAKTVQPVRVAAQRLASEPGKVMRVARTLGIWISQLPSASG